MIKAEADYLFESSWEVCNKCGGINTVIKTKARYMLEYYKNYFFIGPYFKNKAEVELLPKEPPGFLKHIFKDLKREGIICYYGTWQISGEPNTILIDFKNYFSKKDLMKKELWEQFKIDSLSAQHDFDEPIVYSWCVGMLLERIAQLLHDKNVVAHFHEWMAGASLLYLKKQNSRIRTVFTTHATMLGRSLAGSGFDLYSNLEKFDSIQKAKEIDILAKHTTEVACAKNSDIFTTVSEITAIEAEHLLGRKPDMLLLNGICTERYPTIEETSIRHVQNREKLRELLTYHFFPYYTFDLNENLIFFFAGRYEFRNKGLDVLIKALGKLNQKLKERDSSRSVSIFFWVPMSPKGIKFELLENKNYYRHIKNSVKEKSDSILQQIVTDLISRKQSMKESFSEKELLKDLKGNILSFQRSGNPSILTHNLDNEYNDPLIQGLLAEGLDNKPDDKVKVLVYPVYLDGNDGLLDMQIYDAMSGSHLGIFPSYYEPWGYTPVEAAAMGVPFVTSDLSGFGRFIRDKHMSNEKKGRYILEQMNKTHEEVINDLADIMFSYSEKDHAERVQSKINAKFLSELVDWKQFVKFYVEAHNMALEK